MTVVIDLAHRPTPAQRQAPESAAQRVRRKGDPGGGLYKPRTPI